MLLFLFALDSIGGETECQRRAPQPAIVHLQEMENNGGADRTRLSRAEPSETRDLVQYILRCGSGGADGTRTRDLVRDRHAF